ncbi:hypothetical protein INT47_007948 [Mucor saturninus]|uniref:Uncharacterized protein n=1 Tax=Mucor saturninus TaxID=64648 RepID=A0A8H7QRZ0_9FUNG|nr:hypothetical protein INT47_007948 [Mucor saturninus]
MRFAQAFPSPDGVSVNIFGVGTDINGVFEQYLALCEFNTQTGVFRQIKRQNRAPARRNAAFEVSESGTTFIWGGTSDEITGFNANSQGYHGAPFIWHQDVTMYDKDGWFDGPSYSGPTRTNATMTQIKDTNGQLVIIGGATINNVSNVDMVTNFPLANMSDIIVLDPKIYTWTNITAIGDSIPTPRKHHTTTLHPDGHTLIMIGGETFNASGAYLLNDVWLLDTSDKNQYKWTEQKVGGDIGLYRSNHTSILIDDQIWIIAGTNSTHKAVDIQILNVTDWTWTNSAVSTHASDTAPYASLGGVKGLIGLIVGVVVGLLLLASCFTFWWCRRRRIKPFSKNNQPTPPDNDGMVFINNSDPQNHRPQYYNNDIHQDNLTEDNSKGTGASRPSMSTTTSGGIMALAGNGGGDWSNPYHMNSFTTNTTAPTSHAMTGAYYVPQYSGPVTTSAPMGDHYYNNNEYYANNAYNGNIGYHHENGADIIHSPGDFGSTTGAVYSNDQHVGYWDNSQHQPQQRQQFPTENNISFADQDFMLTPMNEATGSRPISRVQPAQALQKPNEVDATNLIISPTETSPTAYTGSTAAEDSRAAPPAQKL